MAPRFSTRLITLLESRIACASCGREMVNCIAEPGYVLCDHSDCPAVGVVRKVE